MGGWTEKPTGKYVLRRPGKDDVELEYNEAIRAVIEHDGYVVLISPQGEVMLTKGTPPPADA